MTIRALLTTLFATAAILAATAATSGRAPVHAATPTVAVSRQAPLPPALADARRSSPVAAHVPATAQLDLCLGIDDSESMWRPTDQGAASDPGPNPLRAQAARIAISLLGADVNDPRDGIGVVLFGTAEHAGSDLVALPVTPLTSNVVREALATRIEQSLWSKGYTRLDIALETCLYLLHAAGANGARSRIVLLTDGVPASGDWRYDEAGQIQAASSTLDTLRDEAIAVDVILLGPAAAPAQDDPGAFVRQIADRTHGYVYVARERTDLFRIYTQIVSSETGRSLVQGPSVTIVGRTLVPVRVEPETASLTVTVVKSDATTTVALRDIAGALVRDQDLHRTSTGLVETLTVQNPAPGGWQVELAGDGVAYVSMVLRPAPAPPLTPPTVAAPATATPVILAVAPTSPGDSHSSLPLRAIFFAVAALVAAVAVVLLALAFGSRLVASHLQGTVALAHETGRRVGLDELARRHRLLGLWQQRMPLEEVFAALGEARRTDAVIARRDGHTVVVEPAADAEGATVVHLVEYGRTYAFGEPPVALVFVADPADLPEQRLSFDAPMPEAAHAEPDAAARLFGPADAAFGDAHVSESPATAEEDSDRSPEPSPVDAVLVAALDDDRWA